MKYVLSVLFMIGLCVGDDFELIDLAYKNGLKSTPDNFKSLLLDLNVTAKELSKQKITLGKKLFFDTDLSLSRDISCASCHAAEKGGADARVTAIGHKDRQNPFHLNTPTILNAVFSKKFFWNGRSDTLQDQAKGPLQASFEMAITPELAEKRIGDKKEYEKMFLAAYGSNEITFEKIANAIASYEKIMVTRGRYDSFLLGYTDALNVQEKKGLELFITKGCVGCHNGIGLGGRVLRKFPLVYHKIWSMSEPIKVKDMQQRYSDLLKSMQNIKSDAERLHYLRSKMTQEEIDLIKEGFFSEVDKIRVLEIMTSIACMQCHEKDSNEIKEGMSKKIAFPFENKGGFLGADDKKYFRVPPLRNIVRTKPYFHNGSVDRLEDAVKIMGIHQTRIDLTDDEVAQIVEFLKAVDGEIVEYAK